MSNPIAHIAVEVIDQDKVAAHAEHQARVVDDVLEIDVHLATSHVIFCVRWMPVDFDLAWPAVQSHCSPLAVLRASRREDCYHNTTICSFTSRHESVAIDDPDFTMQRRIVHVTRRFWHGSLTHLDDVRAIHGRRATHALCETFSSMRCYVPLEVICHGL